MQKTIRIFLSSTFTDTRVDGNKLMEEEFEPVRDLCQQHEIAFEVVDLRWGKNTKFATLIPSMACLVSNFHNGPFFYHWTFFLPYHEVSTAFRIFNIKTLSYLIY